jgi:hypothetical protein
MKDLNKQKQLDKQLVYQYQTICDRDAVTENISKRHAFSLSIHETKKGDKIRKQAITKTYVINQCKSPYR